MTVKSGPVAAQVVPSRMNRKSHDAQSGSPGAGQSVPVAPVPFPQLHTLTVQQVSASAPVLLQGFLAQFAAAALLSPLETPPLFLCA